MDSKFRHIVCLLALIMAVQPVLAGSVHMCMNDRDTGHEHHDKMLTDNTDDYSDHASSQPTCDCGYYCAGTCVHACQVFSLVTTLDIVNIPAIEKPSSLLNNLFVTGYSTVLLRPPAIS